MSTWSGPANRSSRSPETEYPVTLPRALKYAASCVIAASSPAIIVEAISENVSSPWVVAVYPAV